MVSQRNPAFEAYSHFTNYTTITLDVWTESYQSTTSNANIHKIDKIIYASNDLNYIDKKTIEKIFNSKTNNCYRDFNQFKFY